MRMPQFHVLALTALLAFSPGCASVPITRSDAALGLQSSRLLLDKTRDAELRICNEAEFLAKSPTERELNPIFTCAGPVATAATLTTEKHKVFHEQVARAYTLLGRGVLLLKSLSPGSPVPVEVGELRTQVGNILSLIRALAVTERQKELLAIGESLVAEIDKTINAIRGGGR